MNDQSGTERMKLTGEGGITGEQLFGSLLERGKFLGMPLPARKRLIDPWLREADLGMIFSKRGAGKSWLGMELATCLVEPRKFLRWEVPEAVSVLYADGEMCLQDSQQRLARLKTNADPKGRLEFLSSEFLSRCQHARLRLTDASCQLAFEDMLERMNKQKRAPQVIVFDNLSALFYGVDENDKMAWELAANWFLRLRFKGYAVVIVHHAGKSGEQRGTSGREDVLDWVIKLREPTTGASEEEGAHFVLGFTKRRGFVERDTPDLDVKLATGADGAAFSCRSVSSLDAFMELVLNGVQTVPEISEALGVSPPRVYKLRAQAEKIGLIRLDGNRIVPMRGGL